MDEIKQRLIVFVLDNWDTLAAVAVLGFALVLTWLKKKATEDGLAVVVTAIEGFHKSPPPVGRMDSGIAETKQRLVGDALKLLKSRIKNVAETNQGAAKAIDKQVKFIDPK